MMLRICFIFSLFLAINVQARTSIRSDSLLSAANALYENGDKEKAIVLWKLIIEKNPDSAIHYGLALQNLQWNYIEANDEVNLLKYYKMLMESRLNEMDKRSDSGSAFGEFYRNYRYHSTRNLATFYAKKGAFHASLMYADIADNQLKYESPSLTDIIFQKVDLAFWKKRIYIDLGKNDSALYVLVKRSFEYDYQEYYPQWATSSPMQIRSEHQQLSEAIVEFFPSTDSLSTFLNNLSTAIDNLEFKSGPISTIMFDLSGLKYDIIVHSELKSRADCEAYLKGSFFYKYLLEK